MEISSTKLLLIDDSLLTRKMMKEILSGLGFRNVTECTDGREAVRELKERRFDFIISDWHMPHMSGLDLLKHVRTEIKGTKESLPFIMVTSEGEKEQVMEAIQQGVTDYVVKPFNQDIVRAKLTPYFPSLSEG